MYGERKEIYAIVLDFMQTGKSFSTRPEPIAQIMGEEHFTLLEAVPKQNISVSIGERVYIGKEDRDKIALIKSRIGYNDLTATSKGSLSDSIYKIIKTNEKHFTDFFNDTGPLNIREHSLELLPGIGKKNLSSILNERKQKKFESFADITERVSFLQDPVMIITKRVIKELEGSERFYLFTKPYQPRPSYQSRSHYRR